MQTVLASIVMLVGVAAFGFAAFTGITLFRVHLGSLDAIRGLLARLVDGGEAPMRTRLADLEDQVARLPGRWEDIRREAARLDARARSAVARARQELADSGLSDDRLETVADELQLEHGDGSGGGGVLPVPASVASVPRAAQPEPEAGDWKERTRRLKWGA